LDGEVGLLLNSSCLFKVKTPFTQHFEKNQLLKLRVPQERIYDGSLYRALRDLFYLAVLSGKAAWL
jgi:hypothetical protein